MSTLMTKENLIEFVLDFWDMPIEGIARIAGRPHHFKAEFDVQADEYSAVYIMTPMSDETLNAARRAREAWRLIRGQRDAEKMPSHLDAMRDLRASIRRDLAINPPSRVTANFSRAANTDLFEDAFNVLWSPAQTSVTDLHR